MTVCGPPCPKCGEAVGGPSDTFHLRFGKEGCPQPGDRPKAVIHVQPGNPAKSLRKAMERVDEMAFDPAFIAMIEAAMRKGPPKH